MSSQKIARASDNAEWGRIVDKAALQPSPEEAIRWAYQARVTRCPRLHCADLTRELLVGKVLRAWANTHIEPEEVDSFLNGFFCFKDQDGNACEPPTWCHEEAWIRGRDSNPASARDRSRALNDLSWITLPLW